jgi:nitric oxide synthase oxygenase domain/subunit
VPGGSGPNKSILGDPAETDFTEMLMADFGWQPSSGVPGRFDVLPLVLQAHPDQAPQVIHLESTTCAALSTGHVGS